jgi:hypothetical protein
VPAPRPPKVNFAMLGVAAVLIIRASSAPVQQPPAPGFHVGQDLRDVQRRQTPRRMKPDHTRPVAREHAVEHQRVDVHVEIEGSPEPLDDRDGASARLLDASGARMVLQPAEDGAEEDRGDAAAQVVVPREPVPHLRQAQDPLSNGDVGDDAVHQMCGAFRHTATTAARTHRSPLARERDELVEAAITATKPREPARQEPTPEEVPKRPLDKLRHTLAVAQPGCLGQERLAVILHDPVQRAVGGATRFVARGRPGHSARIADSVPASQPHANLADAIRRVVGDCDDHARRNRRGLRMLRSAGCRHRSSPIGIQMSEQPALA